MGSNILGLILSYGYIAAVIMAAKLVEKKGKEASRKFIHILLGFWWIFPMIFFNNVYIAIIGPLSFVILNYISCKKDLIKVMERDDETKDGYGTVYYALSLLILAIFTFGVFNNPAVGFVGVLTMAFGDGLAALIGKKVKSKKYYIKDTQKSVAGSLTMFVVSALIIGVYLAMYGTGLWIAKTIAIAAIVTILEAVSIKGTDNITVPLSVYFMICLAL